MPSVTRKSRSNRTQRRNSVRAELLGAVESLIESGDSYTELSVERLVEEAGISRSTFYVYFEDKGDLLRGLSEDVVIAMAETAHGWWSLPADATKADVRKALRDVFDTYRAHRAVFGAVVDTAPYDPGVRSQFGALVSGLIAELTAHIRDGQRDGYVNAGLDPARTAAWLTWMAERGLHQLVATASAGEAGLLVDSLTEIVWNTLYAGTR
jgi:TetR/AcrR family transcriptional regulator, ethionamide resistance regulator